MILVTGGAGFIGSHLTNRLLQLGHEVVVVDNLSSGKLKNIPKEAHFCNADISSAEGIKKIPKRPYKAICHLAAQSSGEVSAENPLYDMQVNAGATLLLSKWCLEEKIPRFIYASSMVTYGDTPLPKVQEDIICRPKSYYGVSKLTSENLLRIAMDQKLNVTCFRMFSVYGPGQDLDNLKQGMVSIYLAYLLKKVAVPVNGL